MAAILASGGRAPGPDGLLFITIHGALTGDVEYDRGEGAPWEEAFANIWLVRFADDGRAREFAEWWVQKPGKDDQG